MIKLHTCKYIVEIYSHNEMNKNGCAFYNNTLTNAPKRCKKNRMLTSEYCCYQYYPKYTTHPAEGRDIGWVFRTELWDPGRPLGLWERVVLIKKNVYQTI